MNTALIEARMNRGLSSRSAASKIGVSQAVLLNAENSTRCPQLRNAKLIADFYGQRVTDIWPVVERTA